jgi:hypothetical protein
MEGVGHGLRFVKSVIVHRLAFGGGFYPSQVPCLSRAVLYKSPKFFDDERLWPGRSVNGRPAGEISKGFVAIIGYRS